MSNSSGNSTLAEWLYTLEHLHSVEIQLGLERVKQAAVELDLLSPTFKIITIAGTNGKGSTLSALETIYTESGYCVGAYSSPHLLKFNERIRINTLPVSDTQLCEAFDAIKNALPSNALTYFEWVTLAALWIFKRAGLDVLLLEVGLGGRQDATNILDADLAIITTIDFDHQNYLGDTLEEIAYEKAGILRSGQRFIYADEIPPEAIVSEARRLEIDLIALGQAYRIKENNQHWTLDYGDDSLYDLPKPAILLKAAASALVAVIELQSLLPVSPTVIKQALPKIMLQGRLQYIPGPPDLLFDVAHNHQATTQLAQRIKELKPKGQVHAVFSALADKDIFSLISSLRDCVHYWYPAQLNTVRAANLDDILRCFNSLGIKTSEACFSPTLAFNAAMAASNEEDLIVIYGSFYTVGEVMDAYYKSKEMI